MQNLILAMVGHPVYRAAAGIDDGRRLRIRRARKQPDLRPADAGHGGHDDLPPELLWYLDDYGIAWTLLRSRSRDVR